jgi:hypothetical protein
MKRVLLTVALLALTLAAPAAQAAPRQWSAWVNTTMQIKLHWSVTETPFQINYGIAADSPAVACMDRAAADWDASPDLEGSNRVSLGDYEQEYPVFAVPDTGQDYAGAMFFNFNAHGAMVATRGTSLTTTPRLELVGRYATSQHTCGHEYGHGLGFDHSDPLYGTPEVMGYDFDSVGPIAVELAFHADVIQNHYDYPPTLNGPQDDSPLSGSDRDGDGVDDARDECPDQGTGIGVDSWGCQWGTSPTLPGPDPTPTPDPTPEPPPSACSDGRDNDFDGYADYPADPGCSSATDTDEYNRVCRPHKWKPCAAGVQRQGNTFLYSLRRDQYVLAIYDPKPGRTLRIDPATGLPRNGRERD